MPINWYPGHMAKAMRMMESNISICDCIIYVLDARAPISCINEHFQTLSGNKPIIYALNKADLGDRRQIDLWTAKLSTPLTRCIALDSTASNASKRISQAVRQACKSKLDKFASKGIKCSIKAMVVGVPNSGKSTLINNLCGQARAAAANKPGVTKGKQWVTVDEYFEVMDTPGTLPHKLSDQVRAKHLAYIGSITDNILDFLHLSADLLSEINELYPDAIFKRYGCRFDKKESILQEIAAVRKYIVKGGEPDIERAAAAVVDDFRKGRLGQITLDWVQ